MSKRGADKVWKGFGGSGKHASSTKAYHNGGVEGKTFESWYTQTLAPHFDEVLDDAGPKSVCEDATGGTRGGSKGGTHGGTKGGTRGGSKGGTRGGSNGGTRGGTKGGTRGGSKGGTRGSKGGTRGGTRGGSHGGTHGGTRGGTHGGPGDDGPGGNGVPGNTAVTIGVVEFADDADDDYDAYVRIRADEVPDNATPQDYVEAIKNWYAEEGRDLDDMEVRKLVFENDQGQVVASLYRTEDGGWSDTDPAETGYDGLMIPMSDAELAELEAEHTDDEDDDPSIV